METLRGDNLSTRDKMVLKCTFDVGNSLNLEEEVMWLQFYVSHQHSSAGSLWIPGPLGLVGDNQAPFSHICTEFIR